MSTAVAIPEVGKAAKTIVCMRPYDSLKDAWELMQGKRFRHVPIIDEDSRLVAVLSERDILLAAGTSANGTVEVPSIPLSIAMEKHPVTCQRDTRIADVARTMIERKIDFLPVIDPLRRLVGVVTTTDLIRLLTEEQAPLATLILNEQTRVISACEAFKEEAEAIPRH